MFRLKNNIYIMALFDKIIIYHTALYKFKSLIDKIRPLGYERVYLPLCKMADTPFHIQGDDLLILLDTYRRRQVGGSHYSRKYCGRPHIRIMVKRPQEWDHKEWDRNANSIVQWGQMTPLL